MCLNRKHSGSWPVASSSSLSRLAGFYPLPFSRDRDDCLVGDMTVISWNMLELLDGKKRTPVHMSDDFRLSPSIYLRRTAPLHPWLGWLISHLSRPGAYFSAYSLQGKTMPCIGSFMSHKLYGALWRASLTVLICVFSFFIKWRRHFCFHRRLPSKSKRTRRFFGDPLNLTLKTPVPNEILNNRIKQHCLLDGWETLFVAPNGSPLNMFFLGEYE